MMKKIFRYYGKRNEYLKMKSWHQWGVCERQRTAEPKNDGGGPIDGAGYHHRGGEEGEVVTPMMALAAQLELYRWFMNGMVDTALSICMFGLAGQSMMIRISDSRVEQQRACCDTARDPLLTRLAGSLGRINHEMIPGAIRTLNEPRAVH